VRAGARPQPCGTLGTRSYREATYSSTQAEELRQVPSAAFAALSLPRAAATRKAFAESSGVASAGSGEVVRPRHF
jgi:hypothetical protein